MNESEIRLREGVKALKDIVDGLIDALGKQGHPIPKENNKTFYHRCCWVLAWLNKGAALSPDDGVLTVRKTIMDLLPLIREANV